MEDNAQDLLDKYGITPPPCGADCPKGWLPLVEGLIQDLIAAGWDKDCQQVKEKFGGLRFYIGEGNPQVRELIARAESESLNTCQECGTPGTRRSSKGWIYTACDAHVVLPRP